MPYTERQIIYAQYMLQQLGMTEETIMKAYLAGLEYVYGGLEYFPPNGQWYYSVKACINNIQDELNLKKNKFEIKDKEISNSIFITASELGQYAFCPASYSIQKSFEIEKQSNSQSTDIGNYLHEKLRLIKTQIHNGQIKSQECDDELIYSNPLLQFIYSSRVLHVGHKTPLIFINRDENFKGIPDYIFEKNGEAFVVEEKYMYKKDPSKATYEELKYDFIDEDADRWREEWKASKTTFYNNHQVQVVSYVRNIKEYKIKYGFLIYWYYDFNKDNKPYIHKVSILKIVMNEHFENLYQRFKKGILNLKSNNNQVFNVKELNLFKCGACVVNKYCGHKTANLSILSYPYNKNDMIRITVAFPELLKKH